METITWDIRLILKNGYRRIIAVVYHPQNTALHLILYIMRRVNVKVMRYGEKNI